MPAVNGIGAVMIYAADPAALSRWYAEHLGLETSIWEEDGNYYGDLEDAEVKKTVHIGIYSTDRPRPSGRGSVMINYRVPDFEAFLEHLQAKNVEIEKIERQDIGHFAYIQDPEGNPIEIWYDVCAEQEKKEAS